MRKLLFFHSVVLLFVVFATFVYFLYPPSQSTSIASPFCRVKPDKKIALTFDADMTAGMEQLLAQKKVSSWYNRDLMEYLQKHNVKATLFLTGMWAEVYKREASELARSPLFEIGNHSYSHPSFFGPCYGLITTNTADKKYELYHSQAVLKDITGVETKFFRFPGGCQSPQDVKLVEDMGMRPIGWDIVSGDAFSSDTQKIVRAVVGAAHDGAIIVAHMSAGPNAPRTAQAMRQIIPRLRAEGYEFVTVSEILEQKKKLVACR